MHHIQPKRRQIKGELVSRSPKSIELVNPNNEGDITERNFSSIYNKSNKFTQESSSFVTKKKHYTGKQIMPKKKSLSCESE